MKCLEEWRRVLRPHGSIFLNVGDTYFNKSLIGIPGQIEWQAAKDELARGAIGSSGPRIPVCRTR